MTKKVSKKTNVETIDDPENYPSEPKRIYAGDMVIDSDLFKLEITNMLKNLGYDDKSPVLGNVEHCHFYRTYNSSGKYLTRCNFIGGHYHEVSVSVDENGHFHAECGPAIGAKFGDKHSHKVTYIRSDKVNRRQINPAAQAMVDKYRSPQI